MKKTLLLICLSILTLACKERPCVCNGDYTIDQHPCFCVKFKDKIGNNFDSGLDSLKKWYESEILPTEGLYSGKGYFIRKEKINVNYPHDNREFFRIYLTDSVHTYRELIANDIIDDNGNHYILIVVARD